MSEHTKTPWRVSRGGNFIDAPVGGGTLQEVAWCGDCEHGDRNANARHIVHCVNNHERLVEALEDCCEVLEYEHAQSEEARQARALLAELDAGEGGE